MKGAVKKNPSSDFREFLGFLAERIEASKFQLYRGESKEAVEAGLLAEATYKWLVLKSSRPSAEWSEEEYAIVCSLVHRSVILAEKTVEAVQKRILDLLRPMHFRFLQWNFGEDWRSELDWELQQEYKMVGFG